jgi:hypothetical protein
MLCKEFLSKNVLSWSLSRNSDPPNRERLMSKVEDRQSINDLWRKLGLFLYIMATSNSPAYWRKEPRVMEHQNRLKRQNAGTKGRQGDTAGSSPCLFSVTYRLASLKEYLI